MFSRPSTPLSRLTRALSTFSNTSTRESVFFLPFSYPEMSDNRKKTVLVIGAGSVGAIAALNLEIGGLASVTVALRSNYNAVEEQGYTIESCDHGSLKEFRPSVGVFDSSYHR